MEEPIIMRGFFISISLPSEGLFQRRFRDEEIIIDEVQKEFDLIAQKFITRFKTLRATVYNDILPRHTIKIQHTQARAIYFLPHTKSRGFLDEIDGIRKEYANLQADIDSYLKEKEDDWLSKVQQYTTAKNLRSWDWCPNLPSRVNIDLTPLELSPNMLRDFIQSEAEAQELGELDLILREKYRETVYQSVKELEQKLANLIERLSRAFTETTLRKNNLAVAKATLADLEDLTKSANLGSLLSSSFKEANLFMEVLEQEYADISEDEVDKAIKEAEAKIAPLKGQIGYENSLKVATQEAIKRVKAEKAQQRSMTLSKVAGELAAKYGYDVSEGTDPRIILENISLDMRKDLSPRVRALMDEVVR